MSQENKLTLSISSQDTRTPPHPREGGGRSFRIVEKDPLLEVSIPQKEKRHAQDSKKTVRGAEAAPYPEKAGDPEHG